METVTNVIPVVPIALAFVAAVFLATWRARRAAARAVLRTPGPDEREVAFVVPVLPVVALGALVLAVAIVLIRAAG